MNITIVTTAQTDYEAYELLVSLGFPINEYKEENKSSDDTSKEPPVDKELIEEKVTEEISVTEEASEEEVTKEIPSTEEASEEEVTEEVQ